MLNFKDSKQAKFPANLGSLLLLLMLLLVVVVSTEKLKIVHGLNFSLRQYVRNTCLIGLKCPFAKIYSTCLEHRYEGKTIPIKEDHINSQ